MCVCANAEDPARKRIFSAFGAWLKAGFYASWTPIRSHADSRISTGTAQHGVRRNSPRLFLSLTWLLLPCWLLPYCSLWFQKGQNSVWKRFLSKSVLLQGTCTHSEFRPRSTWHIQNATILGNLVNVILAFAHQTDSVLLWGLHGQKKIRARSYTPGEFSCCLWYIFQKWMLCSPFCMWLHVGLPACRVLILVHVWSGFLLIPRIFGSKLGSWGWYDPIWMQDYNLKNKCRNYHVLLVSYTFHYRKVPIPGDSICGLFLSRI